ncbi:MAG: BA14K family protein [Xanthobacter sp.]
MLRQASHMGVGEGGTHDAATRMPSNTPRKSLVWAVVGTICASSLGLAVPVQAQPLNVAASSMAAPLAQAEGATVEQVQWRRGDNWGRGQGWRPPPGPRRGWNRPPPPPPHAMWGNPYWRNGGWYYRNNNNGAWVAAGIAGLALGAAAAAAMSNNNGPVYTSPPNDADAIAYCARKFRSYNPRTGTYTGYDGLQHPCP